MDKRKIIILSEYFAPENVIGAVRMTKIAKYLNINSGYEIMVFANGNKFEVIDDISINDIKDRVKIVRFERSKVFNILKVISHNVAIKKYKFKLLNKITKKVDNGAKFLISFFLEPIIFKNKVEKYMRKIDVNSYSAVISTYGPISGHLIARSMKQKYPNILWIADYRDPVANIFTPSIFKKYAERFPQRVTGLADVIVAVSHGYMEALKLDKQGVVITNGYDLEDLNGVNIKPIKSDKLIFSYTGGLYAGKRDFSILFNAIMELIEEGNIEENNIEIQYAGSSLNELLKQAHKYGLDSIIIDNGYLARSQALELQMGSDILLLATWNTRGGLGNIPGKFFEYMMMGKPIICITSGEIPNGEVKEIIASANIGFCYESATSKVDFIKLKKYILDLYERKVKHRGSIIFNPIKEVVESYSYESKAKDYERLLDSMDRLH